MAVRPLYIGSEGSMGRKIINVGKPHLWERTVSEALENNKK
jgi:hypothetical protein